MQDVDALVDSVLVLLPFEAVMFDIVDGLEVNCGPEGVSQLVFDGTPSE